MAMETVFKIKEIGSFYTLHVKVVYVTGMIKEHIML